MRLLARRTVAATWPRLLATVIAGSLAVGLIAGSIQIGMQAQAAVRGLYASEWVATDLAVQTGAASAPEPFITEDVSGSGGGPLGPDQVTAVAETRGVAAVAGDAAVPADVVGAGGKVVELPLGGTASVRPWIGQDQLRSFGLTTGRAPTGPGEAVLDAGLADLAGLAVGDTTRLMVPQRSLEVTVVGLATLGDADSTFAGGNAFMHPQAVNELAGLDGAWPTLRVAVAGGADPTAVRTDLQRALGGVTVTPGTDLADAQRESVSSLGGNLTAGMAMLSTVGVFVGIFVVAAAFTTLVSQRVPQLALLRTIGATPRQVRRLIRLEALAVGLAAGLLGLLVGLPVALLMRLAMADSGLNLGSTGPQFGLLYVLVPVAVGLVAMQLAAGPAARKAARVAPVAALGATSADRSTRSLPRIVVGAVLLGLTVLLAGGALSIGEANTGTSMMLLTSVMSLLVALTVMGPYLTVPLGWLVGSLGVAAQGQVGRLARATITRNPRRVAMAASTLMLAVALATASGLMLHGMSTGVHEDLTASLRATHGVTALGQTGLPGDVTERVRAVDGVATVTPLASQFVEINGEPGAFMGLTGADPEALTRLVEFPAGEEVVAGLTDGEIALAEDTAAARGLSVGDVLTLRGGAGAVELTVAGTYRDSSGTLTPISVITMGTMRAVAPTSFVERVLVGAAPGADGGAVTDGMTAALAGVPTAAVHDHDGLVAAIADGFINGEPLIFGFLGSAVVIAVFGMVITISLSVAERTREFGLLRAVGATAAQLRAVVRWEAATVVLMGTSLGVGCGALIIQLFHLLTGEEQLKAAVPPTWLAGILAAAAVVALAGSMLPARRAGRVPLQTATSGQL